MSRRILFSLLAFGPLAVLILACGGGGNSKSSLTPDIGEEAKLPDNATIAVSKEAFTAMMKYVNAKDTTGYRDLVTDGLIVVTYGETKVRVIDKNVWDGWAEIRILDGPNAQKSGFVSAGQLRR